MLSGISLADKSGLEEEYRNKERSKKHKKEKKKKSKDKDKKKSSSGKDKQRWDDPSDSGSDSDSGGGGGRGSDGAAAGAAAAAAAEPRPQREDWMTVPMERSRPRADAAAEEKEKEGKHIEEQPQHYGLRYMDPERQQQQQQQEGGDAAAAAPAAPAARRPMVGDGGASWRLKALKRAQEQAKEQGGNVSAIVAERWGSMAELTKSLTEGGRAAHDKAHLTAARQRAAGGITGRGTSALLEDEEGGGRGGGDRRGRDRDRGGHGGDREERGGGRERGGGGRESGGREGDRDRDRDRGGRDGVGGGGGGAKPHYLADVRTEQGQMLRRGAGGGGGGGASLSWRRPGDRERRGGNERRSGGGGDRRGGGGASQAQRDVLNAVAGSLNTFVDDGSFLERFNQQQGSGHRGSPSAAAGREGKEEEEPRQDRHRREEERQREEGRGGRSSPPRRTREASPRRGARGGDRGGSGEWQRGAEEEEGRQRGTCGGREEEMRESRRGEEEEVAAARGGGGDGGGGPPSRAPVAVGADGSAAAAGAGGSNRDVAAALRARLGGGGTGNNRDVAAALRARLGGGAAAAAAAAGSGDGNGGEGGGKEVVNLPLVDASGRAAPGAFGRESAGDGARRVEAAAGGRAPKRVQRYGKEGEKERYFADDDSVDLQTLVKRAKYGDDAGADDMDRAFARNVAAAKRYKGNELDPDAEYDFDGGLELFEDRQRRGDAQQRAQRDKARQVAAFNRQQRAEDACAYCFSSAKRAKHMTIAIGQSTYLALVSRGRLCDGHCYIAPAEHVPSMRQLDDAAWTEVRNFQKCLIQMAMASGRDVLFMETAMRLAGGKAHAVMEAVFVDPTAMSKAPLYFKQAIDHAESEWSQHHAKRLIDTKQKGLRGSVPPGFPYFYVQFGYGGGGYAHVIDDESTFDRDFGRQVAVGLLRLPAEEMHRRSKPEPQAAQERAAAEFRRSFDPYDWTKALAA